MLRHKTSPKGGHHRKNCLLGFIEKCLDNPLLHHLIRWCDKSEGLFQVLWVHAGRSSYHKKTHGSLFDLYREYRGRGITSDPKQAFRMALKKSPCIRATLSGLRDWRTFRIIKKCHQICSAAEIKQDSSSPTRLENRIHSDETKQIKKKQTHNSLLQADFVTEEFSSLVNEDEDVIMIKDDWKDMNTWNNLFRKYDSVMNNYSEISLLDFLDSLPTDSNFPDSMAFKNTPTPTSIEESYNTCRNLNPSLDQSLHNFFADSNLQHQNFDFSHSTTLKGITTSGHNVWANESSIQKRKCYDNVKLGDISDVFNRSTLSSPKEFVSSSPSCCPSCRCLRHHVPTRERYINEVLFLDSDVPPWILASASNYSENNSERCNSTHSTDYNPHIILSQMKCNDIFNDTTLEIESAAVDRLLEEEQNCIDAMFHPSNFFYPESVSRNIPYFNDNSAQAKGKVENSCFSSYLNQNDSFPQWPSMVNFIPSETSKISNEWTTYGEHLGQFDIKSGFLY